jgi:hypothetical protein
MPKRNTPVKEIINVIAVKQTNQAPGNAPSFALHQKIVVIVADIINQPIAFGVIRLPMLNEPHLSQYKQNAVCVMVEP